MKRKKKLFTSWRTTFSGLATLGLSIVGVFFPEFAPLAAKAATVAAGVGLITARDNRVTSEAAGAAPTSVPIRR